MMAAVIASLSVAGALLYWILERRAEGRYSLGEAGGVDKLERKSMFSFSPSYWYIVALCVVFSAFGRPWQALIALCSGAFTASGCAWLSVARISPTPRKDLLTRNRRRLSIGRNILIGILLIGAASGVSLIAHGTLWFIGILLLGGTALGVIACFTFVRIEEIDSDAPLKSWHYPSATTS